MKVVILGGGIIGLTTAYWMARDGHQVTIVERDGDVGQGTSFGNGGQLSYSYVAPLAAPGIFRSLPKWLLDPDGPVRFRLALDPAQWRWIASFLGACTKRQSAQSTERLLKLAFLSRRSLHEMKAADALEFVHRQNGKLVFYSTESGLEAARRQVVFQTQFGCEQAVLGPEETFDLEPALVSAKSRVTGAVFTPAEEVGDCHELCIALKKVLAQPRYKVSFLLETEVTALPANGKRLLGVETNKGVIEGDIYVLCMGIASRTLVRSIGIDLPLYPIKGYSISAPVIDPTRSPTRSITDYDRKIVYAPLGDTLRVAGFADIVGQDRRIDATRIGALAGEVRHLFPGGCGLNRLRPWAGLRPATPTGVPILGASPLENLLLNVGHGALGFTLACGSGRLLADFVAGRESIVDTADYAYRPTADHFPVRPAVIDVPAT